MIVRCVLGIFAGVLAGTAAADPPPLRHRDGVPFVVDFYVLFEEARDEALVWIALDVPLEGVFFEQGADSTRLSARWKVLRSGRQVAGDVVTQRVDVTRKNRAEHRVLLTIPVYLPPGRYECHVAVGQDPSDMPGGLVRDLRIDPIEDSAFALSSLWLSAEGLGGRSRPGRLPRFPLVSRMVHEDIDALSLVGELYAPAGCSERFHVRYRIVDDLERVLQDRSENIPCEGYKTLMVLPIDSEKLAFGDFRVEVTLSAPGERGRITRELWFAADETLVPIRSNFGRALEIAEVIGTDEELDELRSARGEEREALWDEFWTKRDPDPNTERNEFKDDFFDRLRYANRNFATAVTAGWKTDRGYTLLKFGHPDRIERQSFSVDRPVREVWIYVDSGRRFVFEDDGLGSFRLAGTS